MALVKIVYFNELFNIIPYSVLLESKHILDLTKNSKKCIFSTAQRNSLGAPGLKISAYT